MVVMGFLTANSDNFIYLILPKGCGLVLRCVLEMIWVLNRLVGFVW